MTWSGPETGNFFEIAVEARIPESIRAQVSDKIKRYDTVRYELRIELNETKTQEGGLVLKAERAVAFLQKSTTMPMQ